MRSQGLLSPAYKDVERPIGAQLRQHTFTPSRGATPTNATNGSSSDHVRSDYPESPARSGAVSYPLAQAGAGSPQNRDAMKDLASSSKDLKATLESLSASFKVGGAAGNSPAYAKQPVYPTGTAAGRQSPQFSADTFSRGSSPSKVHQQLHQPQSSPADKGVTSSPLSTAKHSPSAHRQQTHGHQDIVARPAPSPTKKETAEPRVLHTEQRTASSPSSPAPTASSTSQVGAAAKNYEWGVTEVQGGDWSGGGVKSNGAVEKVYFKEVPVPVEKIIYKEVPVPYDVPGPVVTQYKEVPVDRIIVQEKIVNVDKVVTKEVPVYIDRFVEKEVPVQVPVDKVVQHEVPVYVDKIIEKVSVVEVPVERVVTKEVSVEVPKIIERNVVVEVDKVVTKDVVHEVVKEIPVEKVVEVPVERIVEHVVEVPVEKVVEREVPVYVDRIVEQPGEVRYVEVEVERIVEKIVEVPVERVVIKEVPVTVEVEKVIIKEVAVPVESERIVTVEKIREVPVDKFIVEEKYIEVPVEKIVTREVEVPVEKIVTKEVEVPVEKIVIKEVQVPVEKIVIKEVPVIVEQVVVKEVPSEHSPPPSSQQQPAPPPAQSHSYSQNQRSSSSSSAAAWGAGRPPTPDHSNGGGGHVRSASPYQGEGHVRSPSPYRGGGNVRAPSPDSNLMSRNYPGSPQQDYSQPPHAPRGRGSFGGGGRRVGLGLALEKDELGLTIVHEAIPGFAAHSSRQVQVGDAILRVDGEPVGGWGLEEIKKLTVGEEGTPCTMSLQRHGEVFEVTLLRVYPGVHGGGSNSSWEGSTQQHAAGHPRHVGFGGAGIIG